MSHTLPSELNLTPLYLITCFLFFLYFSIFSQFLPFEISRFSHPSSLIFFCIHFVITLFRIPFNSLRIITIIISFCTHFCNSLSGSIIYILSQSFIKNLFKSINQYNKMMKNLYLESCDPLFASFVFLGYRCFWQIEICGFLFWLISIDIVILSVTHLLTC